MMNQLKKSLCYSTATNNLVKKTDYNTKINEIGKKLVIMIMINILLLRNLISCDDKPKF